MDRVPGNPRHVSLCHQPMLHPQPLEDIERLGRSALVGGGWSGGNRAGIVLGHVDVGDRQRQRLAGCRRELAALDR